MADDGKEASPAHKKKIANYFIQHSPPGQVDDVLSDVNKLVADGSVMSGGVVNAMLSQYNVKSNSHIDAGDHKFVCSDTGKIDADNFVDSATGKIMTVDHLKRTATDSGKTQAGTSVEAYRVAIEAEMKNYIIKQYKKGKAEFGVFASDDGTITVIVSGLNTNLNAFWSGNWRGIFTVNVKSKGNAQLSGNCKIHVHYFEDGNVQLNAEKKKTATVSIGDAAKTGSEVMKAIEKWENDYQAKVEEMYVDMHNHTFKKMRRLLPKTKVLMNWTTAAHSVAVELTKGK